MTTKHFQAVALLLFGIAGGALAGLPEAAAPDIQQRHARLQQLHDSLHRIAEAPRGQALAARFRELYPDAGEVAALRASNDSSLHLRFADARLAGFYHSDPQALDALRATVAELDRRGAAMQEELLDMRNALLAARRFDEAAAFADAHPHAGMPALPRFVDSDDAASGHPSAWRDAGDGTFERVPLDLGPTRVLVMAGCHFSDDAASGIAADPVLGPAFHAYATWLAMPPGPEDPADVEAWNKAHPQSPLLPLYDRDEWPMFPKWIMPTFYVVRDGQVLGSVRGWKVEGAREELIDLLQRTGLLPPAEAPVPAAVQGAASSSR